MPEIPSVNKYIHSLKTRLVKLGPRNPLVRLALRLHGRMKGFTVRFQGDRIHLRSSDQLMILDLAQYVQVPIMMDAFDLYFRTIQPIKQAGLKILDYSKPGFHQYTAHGVGFYFPSVPEDDSMDVYLSAYSPKKGDVVWDVGAHAGASSYFLSKLVGASGKVYAFEPDESNYQYLLRNIAMHCLTNVIPVRKALSGSTGSASFTMDGTMSAGISDFLAYPCAQTNTVETISISDACKDFGSIPAYIKMDIEGAELASIVGSAEFLRQHPIHIAFEGHRIANEPTHVSLGRIFPEIGYDVRTTIVSGQVFACATPLRRLTPKDRDTNGMIA